MTSRSNQAMYAEINQKVLTALRRTPGGSLNPPIAADQLVNERLTQFQNETFVSFAMIGSAISIWIADNRGMRFHVAEAVASEVISAARSLHDLCRLPESDCKTINGLSSFLYKTLFEPVAYHLDVARELRIHLAEGFPQLPFMVLRLPSGEYFGDTYRFRLVEDFPWRRTSRTVTQVSAKSRALIVDGSAVTDEYRGKLSEHHENLLLVANLLPFNDMLCGAAATPHQFARLVPNAEILHARCSIVMENRGPGLHFGPEDLADLQEPDHSRCVFLREASAGWLSACALAVIDVVPSPVRTTTASMGHRLRRPIHEVGFSMGMVRELTQTLHAVGVQNALIPQWDSSSNARQLYLRSFYRALHAGETPQAAARLATGEIRNDPRWQHVHHWAAFHFSSRYND